MQIRETLDYLYKQYLLNNDKNSSIEIDKILSKAYDIHPLTLFLYQNRRKQFYQTFNNLLLDHNISDMEVARSLSSLLNHALVEMSQENSSYFTLEINKISNLLNGFLLGEKTQSDVKEFFKEYLL